jgi:hypothetical protein
LGVVLLVSRKPRGIRASPASKLAVERGESLWACRVVVESYPR